MRILLVGNYALDRQSSMSRYAEFLRTQMTLRGHHVEVTRPQPVFGSLFRHSWLSKWLGYADKYLAFPMKLRAQARGFDLVHICDHSNAVYLPHTAGRPASITCHDLLAIASAQGRYPQQRISATGRLQQRWIRRHLARARNVVCVSCNTANELAEYMNRDTPNIGVIPNALSFPGGPAGQPEIDRVRTSLGLTGGEKYLLHVGGNVWYKNRLGVLRIYNALRAALRDSGLPVFRLVMVGGFTGEMRDYIKANNLQSAVLEVPGPADEDLRALYTGAIALLFPSLYEGFGWPIIEAQSCGCPVITSNRPPMTEVAADAALYIDPEDELSTAAHIAASLDRLPLLREAGFSNVSRFDPGQIAPRYERFFADVARCHTLEAATPLSQAHRE